MGRFETERLASDEDFVALTELSGAWIDRVHERRPSKMIILDTDSSVSPTYGDQKGSAYNGHFACICCHLFFVLNQFGDLERCILRPGSVHSSPPVAWPAGAGRGAVSRQDNRVLRLR